MELEIESLDAEGRGVAREDGKVVFVEGALAGERVAAARLRGGARFDLAHAVGIERASSGRREPRCPWFGRCGGCATQHADARTQMAAVPSNRFGTPEEFGSACAFLCSANAGFIVGQNLLIDGGSVNLSM